MHIMHNMRMQSAENGADAADAQNTGKSARMLAKRLAEPLRT